MISEILVDICRMVLLYYDGLILGDPPRVFLQGSNFTLTSRVKCCFSQSGLTALFESYSPGEDNRSRTSNHHDGTRPDTSIGSQNIIILRFSEIYTTTINFTRLSVVSVTVGVVDTRLAAATLSGRGERVYTCTCVHDNRECRRLSK